MSSTATGSLASAAAAGASLGVLDINNSSWNWSEPGSVTFDHVDLYHQYGEDSLAENEDSDGTDYSSSGSWTTVNTGLNADSEYRARVRALFVWWDHATASYKQTTKYGTTKYKKLGAVAATASTPTSSSVTATTATIQCNYFPNVFDSTCSAQLQYKRSADSTWTNAGSPGSTGGTGSPGVYSQQTETENITGLTGSTQYDVRLVLTRTTNTGTSVTSATHSFVTLASAPVMTTNAATVLTSSTATLNGTVDPNSISTAVTFQYGTTSGALDQETAAVTGSPFSGDGDTAVDKGITGLTASTTYYFRVKGVHSGGTVYGTELSFTTSAPPATPDITTNAATNISFATATLNGTVNPNTHSTTYHFQYVTSAQYAIDGWTSATATASQGPSTSGAAFAYSQNISGLSDSTEYSFRAVAVYDSVSYYGTLTTFTTTASPGAEAAEEAHVNVYEYDRVYGVETTVYFPLVTPSATNSDTFLNAADPIEATDSQISKDGGDFAATSNLAVRKFDWLWGVTLTATEMQAEDIWVIVHDANGATYRDLAVHVRTKIQTGSITVNADNIGTNTDAIALTSNGTGKAIDCIAGDIYTAGSIQMAADLNIGDDLLVGDDIAVTGLVSVGETLTVTGQATFTAGIAGVLESMVLASGTINAGCTSTTAILKAGGDSTSSVYNGCIIAITSGTGAGQSRIITAYNGGTLTATISADNAWAATPAEDDTYIIVPGPDLWDQSPLAELSALPDQTSATTGTFGRLLQFLFQRFAFKRAQDAATQTLYKADSSTSLATGAFTDTTTLQSVGKLS